MPSTRGAPAGFSPRAFTSRPSVSHASPTPLYREALPEIQTAQEYLPMLRRMLEDNHGNARLVASHLFMQTDHIDGRTAAYRQVENFFGEFGAPAHQRGASC